MSFYHYVNDQAGYMAMVIAVGRPVDPQTSLSKQRSLKDVKSIVWLLLLLQLLLLLLL